LHGPCGAMAHVLGHQALAWYRLEQGLGRCRLVGTTVQPPTPCPKALGADAPQSWVTGARVAIAPTAAHAGIFGAAVAPSASQRALAKASGVLASDAPAVAADVAPETGNTDGGQATPGACQA